MGRASASRSWASVQLRLAWVRLRLVSVRFWSASVRLCVVIGWAWAGQRSQKIGPLFEHLGHAVGHEAPSGLEEGRNNIWRFLICCPLLKKIKGNIIEWASATKAFYNATCRVTQPTRNCHIGDPQLCIIIWRFLVCSSFLGNGPLRLCCTGGKPQTHVM